jgi:hypothetical protein
MVAYPVKALQLQATTGVAGIALVNGTPTILTWTAPSDGSMHPVQILGIVGVASGETGGGVNVAYTDMAGNAQNSVLVSGSLGAGSQPFSNVLNKTMILLPSGGTVSIAQSTALTAGAATLWAEIWGI